MHCRQPKSRRPWGHHPHRRPVCGRTRSLTILRCGAHRTRRPRRSRSPQLYQRPPNRPKSGPSQQPNPAPKFRPQPPQMVHTFPPSRLVRRGPKMGQIQCPGSRNPTWLLRIMLNMNNAQQCAHRPPLPNQRAAQQPLLHRHPLQLSGDPPLHRVRDRLRFRCEWNRQARRPLALLSHRAWDCRSNPRQATVRRQAIR